LCRNNAAGEIENRFAMIRYGSLETRALSIAGLSGLEQAAQARGMDCPMRG
jgi:hypothetical protein